jgi:acetamidase/formamidase
MSDDHDEGTGHGHHHHECGSFFGCGDEKGTGVLREDIKDAAFSPRAADRLLHGDEVAPERLDAYLTARGRARRALVRGSGFMGLLAAVEPLLGNLARAAETAGATGSRRSDAGRVHVVESTKETVRLGVYDANLPPILTVDSGDTISYTNTWSHFLNEMQPGVPVDRLAELRLANPGKGPHSIIGPIAVRGAEPGDLLEVRYRKLQPFGWGAVFDNPGSLKTGLLPDDYAQGRVRYMDLDVRAGKAEFAPNINIPLRPFQGTLGLAPPDGYFPPLSPGVTSSVPPGPHAGNVDLSELTEGSTLYIPVWKPGGLIFTGDSHAVQGDGEICLTALETRMKEMRIQVVLHKQKKFEWPIAETGTHWILLGLDRDLNAAMVMAARNAIKFLAARTDLNELDAYALCSVAVSFRVTQVVDIVRGVHAMIPKNLFSGALRREMSVV